MEMWVDEKQYCHHESNTCDEGKVCGHYTQVFGRLGCARVQCNNRGYVVSCNYDPPGNFIGQTPSRKNDFLLNHYRLYTM